MNLPGTWLLAQSMRLLDPQVVECAVMPTLADLQYEALGAGDSAWSRWLVLARGYAAVLRVICSLFRHGLIWRSPMRRLVTVLGLGALGSVLLLYVHSRTTVGPTQISAFFVMAVLAPIVLRLLDADSSYRQMFASCMGVGMIMGTALFGWVILVANPSRVPWWAGLLAYSVLTGCVALGSALAAAVACRPAGGAHPLFRHRMNQIVGGAVTFTACYALVYTLTGLWIGNFRGPSALLNTLGWATFLGFFFAAISTTVYLPVLLGVRRVLEGLRARLALAILGAVLFPVPLLSFPFLQGRLESTCLFLAGHPITLAIVALPYVLAGAVLGWLVAERPPGQVLA